MWTVLNLQKVSKQTFVMLMQPLCLLNILRTYTARVRYWLKSPDLNVWLQSWKRFWNFLFSLYHFSSWVNRIKKVRWGRSVPCTHRKIIRRLVFPASEPVPSSSQPKKQTHSLQWILLGEDLVISPTCEVEGCRFDSRKDQLQKSLEWSRDTSIWFLKPTLVS